jgi:23S rRNA (pseudouridine1915-N3)-methyltransferase
MRIDIVAVGQRQPAWTETAVEDYLARFPADFTVRVVEVKAEPRAGQPTERVLRAEAGRLRDATAPATLVVALDERGHDWTSVKLAEQLGRWRDAAERPAFVIGGADGLDEEVKRTARVQLRLSSFTLPHALARVVLVEQLYRAWSILARHPYHRA